MIPPDSDPSTPLLIVRADAGELIGTGHMMRCLALAQAWQYEGGQAIFLSHCAGTMLPQRILDTGIAFIPITKPHPAPQDLLNTLQLLQTYGQQSSAVWLLLDGYHFDPVYQCTIRAAGYRLLMLDDMAHWPSYHADILLNQNIKAAQLTYSGDEDTTFLLGTNYALLRSEFLEWRHWQRQISAQANKVLVTMGGSDPDNVTLRVMQALQNVEVTNLEIIVVVGSSNPHLEMLKTEATKLAANISLKFNVNNMPELIAWADVAISAGGSTCWELAFMGLPSILTILATNQQEIVEGLSQYGFAIKLNEFDPLALANTTQLLLANHQQRLAMSRRGRELVDGGGGLRVIAAMKRGK